GRGREVGWTTEWVGEGYAVRRLRSVHRSRRRRAAGPRDGCRRTVSKGGRLPCPTTQAERPRRHADRSGSAQKQDRRVALLGIRQRRVDRPLWPGRLPRLSSPQAREARRCRDRRRGQSGISRRTDARKAGAVREESRVVYESRLSDRGGRRVAFEGDWRSETVWRTASFMDRRRTGWINPHL